MFQHGGLQRDCIAIARRLRTLGHDVEIVCTSADDPPADLAVTVLPVNALTNHGRNAAFSRKLGKYVSGKFDIVGGFDALENLDVLFCGNPPVRLRGWLDRYSLRKRTLLRLECACFAPDSRTELLMLSEGQRQTYFERWHLRDDRVTILPPMIAAERLLPRTQRGEVRAATRQKLGLSADQLVWLFVGSFPQTKGLDRVIGALGSFSNAILLCVGPRETDIEPYRDRAIRLGVASRIRWLGIRDDVAALAVAADLLVHPARLDVTGIVILEAMGNGLPVITSEVCGNARHVIAADAGRAVNEPFSREIFIGSLRDGATSEIRAIWQSNADRYVDHTDLTSGLDVATDHIVAVGKSTT